MNLNLLAHCNTITMAQFETLPYRFFKLHFEMQKKKNMIFFLETHFPVISNETMVVSLVSLGGFVVGLHSLDGLDQVSPLCCSACRCHWLGRIHGTNGIFTVPTYIYHKNQPFM